MASPGVKEEDETLNVSDSTPKNSEEVLIERDGKFELVSASDMQADQPLPTNATESTSSEVKKGPSQEGETTEGVSTQHQEDSPSRKVSPSVEAAVGGKEEGSKKVRDKGSAKKKVRSLEGAAGDKGSAKNSSKGKDEHSESVDSWCASSSSGSSGSVSLPSNPTHASTSSTSAAAQSIIETSSTGARDLDIKEKPSKLTDISLENHPPSMDPKAVSDSFISGSTTGTTSWQSKERTKSAPGHKTNRQLWEEAEMEKRERNECAFKSWLSRKDTQIAEQRMLARLSNRVPTREEHLQKMEQCKLAYRAWLENKTKEIRQRRLEEQGMRSAVTSSNDAKAQSTLSFQQWLELKHQQRQKEHELETRREKEEGGILVKIEPSIAQLAYQR